jgi:hypothetical protein
MKLIRIGDEHAVVIDAAILKRLGITPDTEIEVTSDDWRIIISRPGLQPEIEIAPPLPEPHRPSPPPRMGFPKKQPW